MAKSKPAASSKKKATKPAAKPTSKPAKSAAKPAAKPVAKPAKKLAPAPASAKKPLTKPAAKPVTKVPAKPAAKAPEKPLKGGKPVVVAKAAVAAKPPEVKPVAPAKAPDLTVGADGKKIPPKGITIVNKPVRKPKPKKLEMPVSEPLIKPGSKWKPLIPSGPKAPPSTGIPGVSLPQEFKLDPKAKLARKDLDRYRDILLRKRAELLGDMTNLEDEALRQSSGSLSNVPQHMADQGSDTFDQAMSLSLVDVDRNLIREIDEALNRIDLGTYGVCVHTGKKIPAERLEQVPWTKYTIEAARELERKPIFVRDTGYSERSSERASNANL